MERDPMPMSGSSSYYMHRGLAELHGTQGVHLFTDSGMPYQSNMGGNASGPAMVVEPTSGVLSDGHGVGAPSMQPPATPMRRKRGRPRKYGVEGKMSLDLSSVSAAPRLMNSLIEKRGRGRPPGSGRKQPSLPPIGKLMSGSAGVGFTPHVISVAAGEDIASKLLAFAQQGPRAVCVLSANGAVSTVTLRQPSTSGGTITYEGRFDILCMSGSFLLIANDGSRDRSGGLSISLASPDGRVIGGAIGGMLIAASPVQVVVGSFLWTNSKAKSKFKEGNEEGGESDQHYTVDSTMMTPPSGQQGQNISSPTTSAMGGWGSPPTLDMRNPHMDIDLMRG